MNLSMCLYLKINVFCSQLLLKTTVRETMVEGDYVCSSEQQCRWEKNKKQNCDSDEGKHQKFFTFFFPESVHQFGALSHSHSLHTLSHTLCHSVTSSSFSVFHIHLPSFTSCSPSPTLREHRMVCIC